MSLEEAIESILQRCEDILERNQNEENRSNSITEIPVPSAVPNNDSVDSEKIEDIVIQPGEMPENDVMIETHNAESLTLNNDTSKNVGVTFDINVSEEVISTDDKVEEPRIKMPVTPLDLYRYDEQLMKLLGDENEKMAKAFSVTEFFQLLDQKLKKNKKQKRSSAERILFTKLKDPDYRKLIRLRWRIKSLVKLQKTKNCSKNNKNGVNSRNKSNKSKQAKRKSSRTEKENEVTTNFKHSTIMETDNPNSRLMMEGAINADHNYLSSSGSKSATIIGLEPKHIGSQINKPSSSKTIEEHLIEISEPIKTNINENPISTPNINNDDTKQMQIVIE